MRQFVDKEIIPAAQELEHTDTYPQAIVDAMREEMERDPNVFLIGEDVAAAGGAFGASRGVHPTSASPRGHASAGNARAGAPDGVRPATADHQYRQA